MKSLSASEFFLLNATHFSTWHQFQMQKVETTVSCLSFPWSVSGQYFNQTS